MLKENWRLISRVERIGDCIIVVLAFLAAYYGRDSLIFWNNRLALGLSFGGLELGPVRDYWVVLAIALPAYIVSLELMGAYSSMRMSSSLRLLRVSLAASIGVFFVIATALFLLKLDLSRSFIGLFCAMSGLLITAERYVVLEFLRFWRRRGRNYRHIVICGLGEQAIRVAVEIVHRPELGLRVFGFADLRGARADRPIEYQQFREGMRRAGSQRIGRIIDGMTELEEVFREHPIDEVIFTDVVEVMPQVEEMVLICAEQGIRTTIAADLFSVGLVKSGISYFGDMPFIHFQTPPGDRWDLALKRVIDVTVSAAMLVLLSPVFVLLAVIVKATSPGPVFFKQKRVGLNGRIFELYKFRSMYRDAERQLERLRASNEMTGPVFKMSNDPRVTRIGRIMRRHSIDELPQLWNVLKGDMSLVGPRPPVPGEVGLYERKDRRRLSMRPGMTCTWQVSGRNNIRDFESWVKLDLEYIDNWSLTRDMILLFRTIPAVFFGAGAR